MFQHYYQIGSIVTAIISMSVGLLVYYRNKQNIINITWVFLSLSIAVWSFSTFMMTFSKDIIEGIFWSRALHLGAIFIPAFFIHFSAAILGLDSDKKKIIIFAYILSTILSIINLFTPLLISSAAHKLTFNYYPVAGRLYILFLLMFSGFPIYSVILMTKAYVNQTAYRRNQLRYLIIASLIGFVGGATNFPLVLNIPIYPAGHPLVALYAIIITYAIIKYRLMSINIALTRAGILVVLYGLILGIPFWIGNITKSWLISTTLAVFLASVGPFLYQYLRRRAEDVILKEQKRYQRALRELSKTMTRIRDLDELLKTISSTIVDTVKVGFSAIYIKEEEYSAYRLKSYYPKDSQSRFEEVIPFDYPLVNLLSQQKRPLLSDEIGRQDKINLDSGLVIPCVVEDELLGFMVLGAKPNNQMYTTDDVLVFETLSYSTSLAIENCIFWKEIEDRHRKARLQEMDTYSYSLAHEIDNPMQTILGHTELLKKMLLNLDIPQDKRKELMESIEYILDSRERVSGMVKAIRDFGQKTTGDFKALNIEDVADSFIKLYYPKFKDKAVFFEEINNLKSPVFVRGEKQELMQVLFIVSNNAIHAMTGLKEKKASLKLDTVNHDRIRLSFSDNGYGIKKENLEIIFKPFVTTKASTEGTGMGLHNAKKIIEQHKGKIWSESAGSGQGATFIIELPIAKDIKPEEFEDKNKSKRMF